MAHRSRIITVTGLVGAGMLLTGCMAGSEPADTTQVQTTTVPPADPSSADSSDSPSASESATATSSDTGGAEVTVSGNMEHRITEQGSTHTVRCDGGGDVDVRADNVTLTVSGDCSEIEVDGTENSVTAENSREIDVQGNGNTVEAAEVRELSLEGESNTATLVSVEEIDIEGSDNTVTYESGDPRVDDEGNGSVINTP
ncbi:hypothetical protein BJ994_003196 [Arthrobacter pigmenti]|uniref:DUF3060 domain-containing protein n=1 Tax=Arthrobacter pigmenti TaxID=271432 RepID=A0A846RRD6_9MICC|nr:DUF3060 domain-containing protein [Arthrobacter pigmenti]NJC24120.1 hypothetical protein [Arthrobacter pigmenti]